MKLDIKKENSGSESDNMYWRDRFYLNSKIILRVTGGVVLILIVAWGILGGFWYSFTDGGSRHSESALPLIFPGVALIYITALASVSLGLLWIFVFIRSFQKKTFSAANWVMIVIMVFVLVSVLLPAGLYFIQKFYIEEVLERNMIEKILGGPSLQDYVIPSAEELENMNLLEVKSYGVSFGIPETFELDPRTSLCCYSIDQKLTFSFHRYGKTSTSFLSARDPAVRVISFLNKAYNYGRYSEESTASLAPEKIQWGYIKIGDKDIGVKIKVKESERSSQEVILAFYDKKYLYTFIMDDQLGRSRWTNDFRPLLINVPTTDEDFNKFFSSVFPGIFYSMRLDDNF